MEKTEKYYLNIDLLDNDKISNCDAVIIAEAHDGYKNFIKEQWQWIY